MDTTSVHRQQFYDCQVHMKVWKDSMAGRNEDEVCRALEKVGYRLGADFERQYPIEEIGVADFCFPLEKVVVEVDGHSHKSKKQKEKDEIRDQKMREKGYYIIRVEEDIWKSNPIFYSYLVRDVVEEVSYHVRSSAQVCENSGKEQTRNL